jgi:hypothetical protein
MIKIVLDQHRWDPVPVVLIAELPCQQPADGERHKGTLAFLSI